VTLEGLILQNTLLPLKIITDKFVVLGGVMIIAPAIGPRFAGNPSESDVLLRAIKNP
jgi:hypothetical protein